MDVTKTAMGNGIFLDYFLIMRTKIFQGDFCFQSFYSHLLPSAFSSLHIFNTPNFLHSALRVFHRTQKFGKLWTMWDHICRHALCAKSDNLHSPLHSVQAYDVKPVYLFGLITRTTGHIHIPKLPEIVTKWGKDRTKVAKLIRDCSSE